MESRTVADYDAEGEKLDIKLVYYGAALSGKSSNLFYLHNALARAGRGEMTIAGTREDPVLSLDLLPRGLPTRSGLTIKVKLVTAPGRVAHDCTRKSLLSGADGVVFVADSRRSQCINTSESFQNLTDNCARVGVDFERLPLVMQYNKRDMPDVFSAEEIRSRWQSAAWPVAFASALQGYGVTATFRALLEQCYARLDGSLDMSARQGLSKDAFLAGLTGETIYDERHFAAA